MREPQPAWCDMMQAKANPTGMRAATVVPKSATRIIRHRDAEPFSLLQIFPGEFVRLLGDAGSSPHEYPKPRFRIGCLNHVEDILDVFLGLFQVAG